MKDLNEKLEESDEWPSKYILKNIKNLLKNYITKKSFKALLLSEKNNYGILRGNINN